MPRGVWRKLNCHWPVLENEAVLMKGALLTIDEGKSRVRILPFT
jgi:hypothetical protein